MQREITSPAELLDSKGHVRHPGWSRHPYFWYDRSSVKASGLRIKEWDYYCILCHNHGAAFTVADLGFIGFIAVSIFDFQKATHITKTIMTPFPLGKLGLPPSSKEGDISFENSKISILLERKPEKRIISIRYKKFHEKKDLQGTIELSQPEILESMVIATPFKENPRAFYYNQKINCMPAGGKLSLGERKLMFKPADSFGVLDWGRGVWTYANTWYWGSGSGIAAGKPFGFNIGYGFGDTTCATENMLFFDNKAHKLEEVTFHIPDNDLCRPWWFSSSDSRFEMDFQPIIDRNSNLNLLLLQSTQHQVFGRFTGTAVLDSGRKIEIRDFIGFAEKVYNRW